MPNDIFSNTARKLNCCYVTFADLMQTLKDYVDKRASKTYCFLLFRVSPIKT